MPASSQASTPDEASAWRWLAVSAIQALSESRASRVADAERHAVEQSEQEATLQRRMIQDREDFLAVVAHELKTPVAVVKAYAELLEVQLAEAGLSGQPRRAIVEVVEHVREQADLMSGLIEEVLDVQRVQLGKLPLEISRFDLVQLARSVAEELARATQSQAIHVAVAEPPPYVHADRRHVRQVLVNLLENAVKYSDGGDIEVVVGLAEYEGRAVALVSVHDQGVGLAPTNLERIFDRFVQADNEPVRGHEGLGLGLYVARQLALAHGGYVWAESPGKGCGSTFYFRLPICEAGLLRG
jgi:two-component system phosphate regulon sensor histidine kinase PhoR